MLGSILIASAILLTIFLIVRHLILSEKEDPDINERLKLYKGSSKFQQFYAKNPFRKLSKVVADFERKFPREIEALRTKSEAEARFFQNNRDRYDYLVFKYADRLKELTSNKVKWIKFSDLLQLFTEKEIRELVEGHLIQCHEQQYLIQESYEATHPFEKDENGLPLKIEI